MVRNRIHERTSAQSSHLLIVDDTIDTGRLQFGHRIVRIDVFAPGEQLQTEVLDELHQVQSLEQIFGVHIDLAEREPGKWFSNGPKIQKSSKYKNVRIKKHKLPPRN